MTEETPCHRCGKLLRRAPEELRRWPIHVCSDRCLYAVYSRERGREGVPAEPAEERK